MSVLGRENDDTGIDYHSKVEIKSGVCENFRAQIQKDL